MQILGGTTAAAWVTSLCLLAAQAAAVPTELSTRGSIIMYRPAAVMGFGVGCPIRYKGKEIVELGRGKYAEWRVTPGRYILNNKTSSIEVSVASGETRYVRCQVKMGMLTGRADLQIVDQESFDEHRADYAAKEIEQPI